MERGVSIREVYDGVVVGKGVVWIKRICYEMEIYKKR